MIYFDHAATTLHKPSCVVEAVTYAMTHLGNSGRGLHQASHEAAQALFETRELLAQYFGAEDPSCMVFTGNATESLNLAIKGVCGEKRSNEGIGIEGNGTEETGIKGQRVVTTVYEHNSVLRPLFELERKQQVRLSIVSDQEILVGENREPVGDVGTDFYDNLERAISKDAKVLITTHASNVTGDLFDLEKISTLVKKYHPLWIVDASQSAGFEPINVQKLGISLLAFTGHKALMGPQGTGGLYVKKGLQLSPLMTGGSGIHSFLETMPPEMPEALEAGTRNGHGIAGLQAALLYSREVGPENIARREYSLARRFYEKIKEIPGITVYGNWSEAAKGEDTLPFEKRRSVPIVSLNIGDQDSALISDLLWQDYEICTRSGAHCAPLIHKHFGTERQGMVRFSFSYFDTEQEVDQAVLAIQEIAADFT